MTVAELIEKLQAMPQDADVKYSGIDSSEDPCIFDVSVNLLADLISKEPEKWWQQCLKDRWRGYNRRKTVVLNAD